MSQKSKRRLVNTVCRAMVDWTGTQGELLEAKAQIKYPKSTAASHAEKEKEGHLQQRDRLFGDTQVCLKAGRPWER